MSLRILMAAPLVAVSVAGAAVIALNAPGVNVAEARTLIQEARDRVNVAKAQGIVGEQADGLLGFRVASSDAELRAAVAEINQGRLELYRQAAAANGVSVEAAGASSFQQRFASIPNGQWYRNAQGQWVQKS